MMPPADLNEWHLLALLIATGIACLLAWDIQKGIDKEKADEC